MEGSDCRENPAHLGRLPRTTRAPPHRGRCAVVTIAAAARTFYGAEKTPGPPAACSGQRAASRQAQSEPLPDMSRLRSCSISRGRSFTASSAKRSRCRRRSPSSWGKLFGDGAGVWLRMQAAYDQWRAEREVDIRKILTLTMALKG